MLQWNIERKLSIVLLKTEQKKRSSKQSWPPGDSWSPSSHLLLGLILILKIRQAIYQPLDFAKKKKNLPTVGNMTYTVGKQFYTIHAHQVMHLFVLPDSRSTERTVISKIQLKLNIQPTKQNHPYLQSPRDKYLYVQKSLTVSAPCTILGMRNRICYK